MEPRPALSFAPLARFVMALTLGATLPLFAEEKRIDFATTIKPILESRCLECHNDNTAKGDLSLTSASAAHSQHPDLLLPDAPDRSLLLQVIRPHSGEAPEMPKKGAPLTKLQIGQIQQWLAEGAIWPEDIRLKEASLSDTNWWAYQPLATPNANDPTDLDGFITQRLQQENLQRNPRADRRTLIRRATYDLTGLPPTPEAVDRFVQDSHPQAYERLLDQLLASPQYGERWGRHWLDVVRFGESNGYERNVIINNLWPFRDYVIRSINQDKPFDQFIREHLAGDIVGEGRPEVSIGTAFLVAGPYDDVGNQDAVQAAQIRANTLDEMIRTTTEAFLGMTVGCARCHDHKFDPITQADYYRLYASFAAIRHGSATWATEQDKAARAARVQPLEAKKAELENQSARAEEALLERARTQAAALEATWVRPKIDRTGVEERFEPATTRFVRLVSEGQDSNPRNQRNFNIDEFEIWSHAQPPVNVALRSNGASATGEARRIEDFADAYNANLAIDGRFGARFIATGGTLTIELAQATEINRIYFSSARGERTSHQGKFSFVGEYRIEISDDGQDWRLLVNSHDRLPVNEAFRDHRLKQAFTTAEDRQQRTRLRREINRVNAAIKAVPDLPTAFLGRRQENEAKGPFHLFLGGSPQRKGPEVLPASLSTLEKVAPTYELSLDVPEAERRRQLAAWITSPQNPLTPRVLANRIWHYHFGTGLVDTPSDFGYLGGRPSHPALLDFLARELVTNDWQIKALHKTIMLSETYRQSSTWRPEAARVDGASRLLWRFSPRRLSAEEIRDTLLTTADRLHHQGGGPGFRLYRFMQDNVSTYEPLDQHGSETYRRAVYHQNVRASVVDLMTDFDQPDCAFSAPRRAGTTSPLQALTLLNHQFTIDMASALAERLASADTPSAQVDQAFRLAFQRRPDAQEQAQAQHLIQTHGLAAFCRALLNTNELIYLD